MWFFLNLNDDTFKYGKWRCNDGRRSEVAHLDLSAGTTMSTRVEATQWTNQSSDRDARKLKEE